MARKQCLTEGCDHVAKARGICTKCYGTLRVFVAKGKLTWDQAVEAGLCEPRSDGPEGGESSMAYAIRKAAEDGKVHLEDSKQAPALDPDQEPPTLTLAEAQTAKVTGQLPPPPIQMPQVNAAPEGYGEYDPNAKPAPAAPEPPRTPRDEQQPPEPMDTMDLIDEDDDFDETPEQRKRRQQIENRWKREQRQSFVEQNGFEPPKDAKIVVVPPAKKDYELNEDPYQKVSGVGAGNPPPANRPPGVYIEPHAPPAGQTIDGEPLLPGWQLSQDGVNLINPQGQLVHTDPRIRAQQTPATVPTQLLGADGQPVQSTAPAPAPEAPVAPVQPAPAPQAAPENTGLIPQSPQPMDVDRSDPAPWERDS